MSIGYSRDMPDLVGLVPAAGQGTRFGAAGYSKELFPLLLASQDEHAPLAPRPLCELTLRGIEQAGARRCVMIVSPDNDLVRVLGHRPADALSLAYTVQQNPQGLPHAVRCARPWLGDSDVMLALPDTIILPSDALARVHTARVERGADLALGVFPVDEPERLGPVEISDDGTVLHIYDKPATTTLRNSWGLASWSARFTEFCCRWDEERESQGGERVIGDVFEAARAAGFPVVAVTFDEGRMLDVGTPVGLRSALKILAEQGVVD
jgi:glucose-1-phosphate thymidylyltransferase